MGAPKNPSPTSLDPQPTAQAQTIHKSDPHSLLFPTAQASINQKSMSPTGTAQVAVGVNPTRPRNVRVAESILVRMA